MAELTEPLPPRERRAIARSLVIALALSVVTLQALPGEPLQPDQLALPINARPIAFFEHTLGALGLASPGSITQLLLSTSKHLCDARHALLRPFGPLFRTFGTGQRWDLFASKGRGGYCIQIEALTADQQWHVVYVAHQVDELGLAPLLRYRRLRGIYDPRSKDQARAQYEPFVNWIGNLIMKDHPEYLGVRVEMQHLRLGSRTEPNSREGFEHIVEVFQPGTP